MILKGDRVAIEIQSLFMYLSKSVRLAFLVEERSSIVGCHDVDAYHCLDRRARLLLNLCDGLVSVVELASACGAQSKVTG